MQLKRAIVLLSGGLDSATVLAIGASLGAAILAIVPFVGYALVVAAGWFALRNRQRAQEKYAGLRVLR